MILDYTVLTNGLVFLAIAIPVASVIFFIGRGYSKHEAVNDLQTQIEKSGQKNIRLGKEKND